jgi:hypothetical protein
MKPLVTALPYAAAHALHYSISSYQMRVPRNSRIWPALRVQDPKGRLDGFQVLSIAVTSVSERRVAVARHLGDAANA